MDANIFHGMAKLIEALAGGLVGIYLLTHGARWFAEWRASGRP